MGANADNQPTDDPTLPPKPLSAADQPTVIPGRSEPTHSPAPVLDGYEILSELGRGGMGVVYKARDTNLDRTVALKMVLGGKFASAEEIQRFRIEGEAAARLDHPGIVPIYDIGEADGNHFFSMKFIDGAALADRLEDYQADERKTAELLIKIARAVQHAHQRGVLHRDLKPANVLIDEHGDPSVTDLGLAKRMDGESELTQTGLIMGTPGFMAPEQAAGKKDVTTAADVFSLGAILYWVMTGEAPFKGENAVQTVMQTLEDETPSVRATVPDASADLDLICQKAMHKDPTQRYSSAAALADDLQAWLDGDMLSVRPPTALSVASLWIRKNLRTVLGSCLSGAICGLGVGSIVLAGALRGVASREFQLQQLGGSSGTWVANFLGLRNVGAVWEWSQFLIVPVLALAAFLCVLIVRPQSRQENLFAGVTSGLVAGMLTFLTSLGWIVTSDYAQAADSRDLEVLSTAVWLESDAERKLAQQALIQRYPGLRSMDATTRQLMIRAKVEHDIKTNIMPGMWVAVIASFLFTTMPMFATCVLSGMLWQEGTRGWQWFGETWERGAYCLVFFLIISFSFRDLPPSLGVTLGALLLVGFALWQAIYKPHLALRLLMIPVPFVAMFWVGGDVDKMRYAWNQAADATNDAELREAASQFDRQLTHLDSGLTRYYAAITRLHLGDEDQYRNHCQAAMREFENAYEPGVASRLAKMCLLRPDLQDSSKFDLLYSLSEFASAFESDELVSWYQTTRALVELRRGNPQQTLEWNQKAAEGELPAVRNLYRQAQACAIDALAHLKLGDKLKAQASLDQGRDLNRQGRESQRSNGSDRDTEWVNRLVFQILEKEALTRLK